MISTIQHMVLVNVGGERSLLKRLSELRPLYDRTDHIISTEDSVG